MLDILTNPITLLCLGIVFLLISLLFFYFKRTISVLEKAQMEQAHILQSFISNMEMSRAIPYNNINHNGLLPFNKQNKKVSTTDDNKNNIDIVNNDDLITVSDDGYKDIRSKSVNYDNLVIGMGMVDNKINRDEDSDDEDSNHEDSNHEDSDDEDSDDEDSDDEDSVNVDSVNVDINEVNIVDEYKKNDNKIEDIANLNTPVENIKVIQLVDEELLDIKDYIQSNNKSLEEFDHNFHSILDTGSVSGSDSDSDSDSQYDSDSDGVIELPMNRVTPGLDNKMETSTIIKKNVIHSLEKDTNKHMFHTNTNTDSPSLDIKSLNVQSLRQLAENKQLVQSGEKKSKKELIKLLESHKQ